MAKVILIALGVLVLLLGLGWFLSVNDLLMTGFFSPRYEQVRRNTFEQSRAFNEGMQQELQGMRRDYIAGDAQAKAALKSTILHRVAAYDLDNLKDPSLRSFIQELRSGN